jgi:hypothetical protein
MSAGGQDERDRSSAGGQAHCFQLTDRTPAVTPAKAGVHRGTNTVMDGWTPAFAGVTIRVGWRAKAFDPPQA